MDRYTRLNGLLDAMTSQGHIDVAALANSFGVSASTIRRDLNHLHSQQLVVRTRGGAVASTVSYDLPVRYRNSSQQNAKTRIGRAAADMVRAGAIVGLNGGTTTTEVARALAERSTGTQEPITIVTNAINIAGELTVRRHVKLVMTGGVARPQTYELVGSLAADTLRQIELDIAILAVDAFDPREGARAHDEEEASINRLMAQRAQQLVIVADCSKLTARAFASICPVSEVSCLITDTASPAEAVQNIRDQGVTVVLV